MQDGHHTEKAGGAEPPITDSQEKDMVIKRLRRELADNEEARIMMSSDVGLLEMARKRQKAAEDERDAMAVQLSQSEATLQITLSSNKILDASVADYEEKLSNLQIKYLKIVNEGEDALLASKQTAEAEKFELQQAAERKIVETKNVTREETIAMMRAASPRLNLKEINLQTNLTEKQIILKKVVQHVECCHDTLRRHSLRSFLDIATEYHHQVAEMVENIQKGGGVPPEPLQVPVMSFQREAEEVLAAGVKLLQNEALVGIVTNPMLLAVPTSKTRVVVRDAEASRAADNLD